MHTLSLNTARAADISPSDEVLLQTGMFSSRYRAGLVTFVPINSLLLLAFRKSSANRYSCSFGTAPESKAHVVLVVVVLCLRPW